MTIGFIGTGAMGGAIIQGIAASELGRDARLCAYDQDRAKLARLEADHGVAPMESEAEVARASDVLLLAVKPNVVEPVLVAIRDAFRRESLLITIAVGLPISLYTGILGEDARIVRTMPNTPALVGKGMTAWCASPAVTQAEKDTAVSILSCVGMTEALDEKLMGPVTALTGSSPAYVFMFLEAMADAAVQSGIPRATAYRMAAQAVAGSAELMLRTGKHPGELKDMVCSPAGTTIDAVAELERCGMRSAIISAMKVCTDKAEAIGRKYGGKA